MMGKILQMFKKFKHVFHEMDNAEKLGTMLPRSTVYDVQHQFSYISGKNGTGATIFSKILTKQPEIYHSVLNIDAYKETNAQNKVLLHGILYKTLFDIYINYTKTAFNDDLLTLLSEPVKSNMAKDDKRIILDFVEYQNLPKRFRGIFVKYDIDRYILNVPTPNMTITYKKQNQKQLEKLLLEARMLIPVIYKTVTPDITLGSLEIYEHGQKPGNPAFVSDSELSGLVTDEQLNTICRLHDIFVEIAKISLPIATEQRPNSAALEIFKEYQKELSQKDIFVIAQAKAKANQEEIIKQQHKAFTQKEKQLQANYREFHSGLIAALTQQTSVHIQ